MSKLSGQKKNKHVKARQKKEKEKGCSRRANCTNIHKRQSPKNLGFAQWNLLKHFEEPPPNPHLSLHPHPPGTQGHNQCTWSLVFTQFSLCTWWLCYYVTIATIIIMWHHVTRWVRSAQFGDSETQMIAAMAAMTSRQNRTASLLDRSFCPVVSDEFFNSVRAHVFILINLNLVSLD